MKIKWIAGMGAPVLGLLSLAGMGGLTGCSNVAPVQEQIVTAQTCGTCPGVRYVRVIRTPEPSVVRPWNRRLSITAPGDRYYNPMTRGWERPWPYGPYGTADWR